MRQVRHLMQKKVGELTRLVSELEVLKKQNDEFGTLVAKNKEIVERLSGEIAALKAELEREKRSSGAIASELQRTRDLKIELEQDLKTALERAARLEKRMSNRDSEDFRRLTASQGERKKLADQIATLQEECVRLKAEMDVLRKENATLTGETRRLR